MLRGRLPAIALWQRALLLLACLLCWFYACYGLNARLADGQNPGSWPLIAGYALASLGCVLLLIAFLGLSSSLLPGWAVYLGRISYGLYVFHGLAAYTVDKTAIRHLASLKGPVGALKGLLELGLTVLMAAVSYRFFETPFLKFKRRHAAIESQPIASSNG